MRSIFKSRCAIAAIIACSLVSGTTTAYAVSASWLTAPNFPTAQMPVVATSKLSNGLTLQAGSQNLASMRFGGVVGANVKTRTALDSYVYYNPITGNQLTVTGTDGIEGVNSCYACARRYAEGSAMDLHPLDAQGLHLMAKAMDGSNVWKPGQVASGMVRINQNILPGMTVKIRAQTPSDSMGWLSFWLYGGVQVSPRMAAGANGNPYYGYGSAKQLLQFAKYYQEIDIDDDYTRSGYPTARAIDFGVVRKKGGDSPTMKIAPHTVFAANSQGFNYVYSNGYPFEYSTAISKSSGIHEYVLSWRNDGSNLVDFFLDGTLYAEQYYEFPGTTYVDGNGAKQTIGMNLIISNQAVPNFLNTTTQGGQAITVPTPQTMSGTIEEVSIYQGNVDLSHYVYPVNGLATN